MGRYELRNVIRAIQATGKTIFLNSHLLSEVEEISDEIAILHRGAIVQQGSVAAITASVAGRGKGCLVTFTTAPLAAEVLAQLPASAAPVSEQRGFQIRLESESEYPRSSMCCASTGSTSMACSRQSSTWKARSSN